MKMQFSAATLYRLFLQILKEELDYSGTLNPFLNNKNVVVLFWISVIMLLTLEYSGHSLILQ